MLGRASASRVLVDWVLVDWAAVASAVRLRDGQHLSGAGFEPAQVDHAGRDHLALLQRGHPGRRDEHPFAARNLDDQADDPGRGRRRGIPGGGRGIPGGHGHDDVVHPTHLVSQGVEHRQPGELG